MSSTRFSHFSYSSHALLQLTWHLVRARVGVRATRATVRVRVSVRVRAVGCS